MSELIDRQALKDYVSSLSTHPLNEWDTWGVLAAIDKQPTVAVPRWHRVEDEPRDGQECIVAHLGPTDWIYEHATYHSDLNKALEEDIFIDGTDGFIVDGDVGYARHGTFNYWMPIEPPKEDADANK